MYPKNALVKYKYADMITHAFIIVICCIMLITYIVGNADLNNFKSLNVYNIYALRNH